MALDEAGEDPHALDANLIGMKHPDGMAALENGQIAAHLTSSPYIQMERKNEELHEVGDMSAVWSAENSYIVGVASEELHDENPEIYQALCDGIKAAMDYINENPEETAEFTAELDGNTVTEIGDRAFKDIYFVDEITCPDTVTAVGDNAFENCIRLKSVNLPKSLTTIGNYVFSNTMISSVVIPKMLTEAGDSGGAFSGATELETAVFEDGMEGIPNYLFQNATALKEIVIPDSVTWIGQYSFSGCVFLRKVTFGNSIDIIYNSAFENCISLTYVKFPDSITNIRVEAFKGCTNLRSVILPRSLRWLGGAAFKGTAISSIEIPKSLTYVTTYDSSSYSFNGNSYSVPGGPFSLCENLKSVTFEESCK